MSWSLAHLGDANLDLVVGIKRWDQVRKYDG